MVGKEAVGIFQVVTPSHDVPQVSISPVSNILSPSNGMNRHSVPVNTLASDELQAWHHYYGQKIDDSLGKTVYFSVS